jgi:hypothetical protein
MAADGRTGYFPLLMVELAQLAPSILTFVLFYSEGCSGPILVYPTATKPATRKESKLNKGTRIRAD